MRARVFICEGVYMCDNACVCVSQYEFASGGRDDTEMYERERVF